MNIVCTYDVDSKKCPKIMKILRKYLYHTQNSVFHGSLTPKQFRKLKKELEPIITKTDSLLFFYTYNDKDLITEKIGKLQDNPKIIM